jgi:PAS domain S-box-containing protein
MKKRRSLNQTWYGLVILITILPMIILILWIGYRAHSLLLNDAIQIEKEFNNEIKSNINLEFNRIITILQNKSDPMAFTLNRTLNKDLIEKLFETVLSREKAISSLSLISWENQVILSMDRDGTILNGTGINKKYSGNESKRPEYEHLINTEPPEIVIPLHGRTYVSSPTIKDNRAVFSIGIPVGPLSSPVAVLVASVNAEILWNNVKSILLYPEVNTYLVDSHGSLLLKPSFTGLQAGKLVTHMNIVRTLIANKEWDITESYTGLSGKHVFGIASYIDTLNWGVISEIPRKKITDPIYTIILSVTGVIVLIGLLSVGIGLLFVSRLLKPFALLGNAFERVSSGDYTTRMDPSSVKEIDNIVDGFNRMTQEIKHVERKLRELNESLEDRVNKRTFQLKESEISLNEAQHIAGIGSWEYNLESRQITWSDEQYRIHGYEPNEIEPTYEKITDAIHPDDRKVFLEKNSRCIEEGGTYSNEYRIIRPDGSERIIYSQAKLIRDDSGNLTRMPGTAQDITERKRNEMNINAINSLNEELFHPDRLEEKLSLITNRMVKIFNADFCRIWITKPGDKCDSGCIRAEIQDEEHVCRQRDRCLHLVASSGRYTHIDGKVHSRVPFGCYKIGRMAAGDDSKYISNDIMNDRFIHDKDWARKLGLVSFACFRLFSSTSEPIGVLAIFSKNSILSSEEILLEGIANNASKIIQSSNSEDVRKKMEDTLLQSEKLKSLGIITAGIAHEFNNILAVMIGCAEVLEGGFKDDKELKKGLNNIIKAGDDGADIVRNMLTFAKSEGKDTIDYTFFDIRYLINEAIDFTKHRWRNMAQSQGIDYKIDKEGVRETPEVLCNTTELREVFTNIINNALDAMPDGGTLSFSTWSDEDTVFISISDTGVGMPEDVKMKIFDPFFTTRRPLGTGLGMSVSYGIIVRHGGNIEVESEEGKGTTFSLSIPIRKNAVQKIVSPGPARQVTTKKLNILVVDDSEKMCVIVDNLLTRGGHTVKTLNNGAEAIALTEKEDFDLVLCDLAMPNVYGYDVIKAINKLVKMPKIGIVTGWEEELKSIDDENFKVDFIIKKPFKHSELTKRINELFGADSK